MNSQHRNHAAVFAAALVIGAGLAGCGSNNQGAADNASAQQTIKSGLSQAGGATSTATGGGASASTGGATTATPAPNGKELFASEGCAGCHTFKPAGSNGTVGPNLAEISKEGSKAVLDAIVKPNADIPPGYKPNVMPQDFGKTLTKAQLAALVAFIVNGK